MAFSHRTLRGRRYYDLRELHMTPIESRAFSQLTRKYPALKQLIAARSAQWEAFKAEARTKGWQTEHRRKVEWGRKIVEFYDQQRLKRTRDKETGISVEVLTRWIVRKDVHGRPLKRPRISPWEWYDDIFQKLPAELRWDTPRSHRIKQADVKVNKIQMQKWIVDLKKAIARTDDKKQRAQFQVQIDNLRRSMRR